MGRWAEVRGVQEGEIREAGELEGERGQEQRMVM